jgi:predicted metalloprotease with PDZ domain
VFAHELAHVRQSFTLADGDDGPSMHWLLEGMAEYQAAVVELRSGRLPEARFRERVTTDAGADAVLADRSTWSSPNVPYDKGERVVAALDAEIRLATDGERSIVDVWRLLNAHEGTVSYGDFVAVVEAVAGTEMRDWLDRYVRSDAAPSVPDDAPGLSAMPDDPPTSLDAGAAGAGIDAADPAAASPVETTSVAALGVQRPVAEALALLAAFVTAALGLLVLGE